MRTSSYIIPVKLESETNKYMLIHGYTGAMDIVTDSLLAKIKNISSENTLSEKMAQTLQKRGYITDKNEEEEYAYVARIANALHQRESILMKNFTWVVTYNCNFRCPYCFERRDLKDGKQAITFNPKMVDKAYKAMEEIEPIQKFRSPIITLYGGEPLLVENKNIVTYIVEEGCKRGYKFTAITNGYDLNHYLDLLSIDKINKLQITIDGTKNNHNQKRIHHECNNTFDKILNNVQLALTKGVEIVVRINTDNKNAEDLSTLKSIFEKLNLTQHRNFNYYSALLRNNENIPNKDKKKLEFLSTASFFDKQKMNGFICQDFGIYQKVYNAMKTGKPIPLRSSFCSSQTGGYVLDPMGHIYPCWETIGNSKYQIGNFMPKKIQWNKEIIATWHTTNVGNNIKCKLCKYALFCGGGCYIHQSNQIQCYFFRTKFQEIVNRAFAQLSNNY